MIDHIRVKNQVLWRERVNASRLKDDLEATSDLGKTEVFELFGNNVRESLSRSSEEDLG